MKKTTAILMLFVLGMMLCPAGVFAEDVPDEEMPEAFGVQKTVALDEAPVPEPDPGPEPCE